MGVPQLTCFQVPISTSWLGNLTRTKVITVSDQGTALYELYLSIQQRALRAFHDPATWEGLGSGDVLSMLSMAGEHLQECIDCLKYEPSHQAEGKLCEQARDEQMQLAGLMSSVRARMEQ